MGKAVIDMEEVNVVASVLVFSLGVLPIFVVSGALYFNILRPSEKSPSFEEGMGQLSGTLSFFCAIIVGLVTSVAMAKFQSAGDTVHLEANAIADLRLLLVDMEEETITALTQILDDYVDTVISQEWPNMAEGELGNMEAGYNLREMVRMLESSPGPLASHALNNVESLSEARRARLTAARGGLPEGMWGAVLLCCLVTMVYPVWVARSGGRQVYLMLGLVSGALICVLFLLYGMSYPFSPPIEVGYSNMPWAG